MTAIGSIVPRRVGQQHGPSPSKETKSMSKRTVLVVDLQNDYLPTGKFPLVGIGAAIDNAARVIADARAKGDKVVHVRHEFPGADAPFFAPGSDGAQIHSSVGPDGDEPVIVKNQINAFLGTDRSEEQTSKLQSLMRISSADICLKQQKMTNIRNI